MPKVPGLTRIAKLYAMVEGLHAMRARAAAGAVFDVDRASERLTAATREGIEQGRAGLRRGSRIESVAAHASLSTDAERRVLLARLRTDRQLIHQAAVEIHRESRVELRQIEGMVERMRLQRNMDKERRTQHASDDRFLSRREWLRAKQPRPPEGSDM